MLDRLPSSARRVAPLLLVLAAWAIAPARTASAQVGALVSPGPLARAHTRLEGIANCQRCHEPGRKIPAAKCLSCHKPIADRMASKKGVHRSVTGECEGCHAEHAGVDAELRPFDPGGFDHGAETGFPLEGRHAPLARACARCHKTRSFLEARPACASCHDDVHKGSLGDACVTCHTTSAPFAEARRQFDHAKAKFALTGAHRTVECARCHVNRKFAGLAFASCTDCHREPHRQAFGTDCASCHSTETWHTRKVDHARTAFPLTGAHASAPCAACHVKPATKVRPPAAKCSDCHADVHRGGFKQDCSACHTTSTFKKAPFDHEKGGRFPLTGRHAGLACSRCHKGAATAGPARTTKTGAAAFVVFTGLSAACASCHDDPHKGAAGPTCLSCHTTTQFKASQRYAHAPALTPFFAGQHAVAGCRACHTILPGSAAPGAAAGRTAPAGAPVRWTFKGTPTACVHCHADTHEAELGQACERCHAVGEAGFRAGQFSHAATTFPLTGRHQTVACAKCHAPRPAAGRTPASTPPQVPGRDDTGRALQFKGRAAASCASCHGDVHLGQLGPRCETCHTTQSFGVAQYTHAKAAAAFFTGEHANVACRSCHKPETALFPAGRGTAVRYVGRGTACASCHEEKDAHRGALGGECERCHTPERWPLISRAFHKAGLFPLEGRHLAVPCASCHLDGVTRGTPNTCYDCHWVRRQDDPKQTRLGTQCESCHRPTSWTAVNWNHAERTGFSLSGRHQAIGCESCHKGRRFLGGAVACAGCHMEDYQKALQPNHAAAGFPVTCEVCHQPSHTSWSQAAFRHTAFQLVGAHASQPCASCHKGSGYAGTPRDCIGCHLARYQQTSAPNHAAAGFPTSCEQCHQASASSWGTGAFNHASVFALVGVHATQACVGCHGNGVYKGTPRDCAGCHMARYQQTANPNHAAAGFPPTCEQCHQASAPAWTSNFNHNQVFPLLGRHLQQPCSACHKNNVYRGTPTACVACHQASYDRTTSPNHAAAGFPTACESCHKAGDASWRQGVFNHTRFPITSGRHAGIACATCHTSANNYRVFSCVSGCHGRGSTDGEHREVNGYRYDSAACYACHPTGRGDEPRP